MVGIPLFDYIKEGFYSGEGEEPFALAGEKVQGGEIVEDSALAGLYKEALESGRTLEPDPTIIRSTIHNTMLFFGTPRQRAEVRSQNVSLSNGDERLEGCRGGAACVYDTSDGLGVEITPRLFYVEDVRWGWLALLQALAHEAYHLSVRRVDERPRIEDFGVLGKYNIFEDIRGFWRSEEYQGEIGDLVNRVIVHGSGGSSPTSMAEEFFAEVGKDRYFQHLSTLGLGDSEDIEGAKYSTPYPFFRQGIVDVQDTKGDGTNPSWQEWWGGALDFRLIDRLHYRSDRMPFFEGLGERIVEMNVNPKSKTLSRQDTAALGLVAYNDFFDYDLTNHELLSSLTENPIDPESIVANAQILLEKLPESYALP